MNFFSYKYVKNKEIYDFMCSKYFLKFNENIFTSFNRIIIQLNFKFRK